MKTRFLPVKLTDEELLSRARDMSQALSDKTQKEEERQPDLPMEAAE